MAAHGGVPQSGVEVLACRAFLEVDPSVTGDDMKVHHRMQQTAAAMHRGTRGPRHHKPGSLHHRQHFRVA